MPALDLSEFLNQLRGASADLRASGEQYQASQKAQRLRDVGKRLPEIMQNGGGLGLAGELFADDPATARQLIKDSGKASAKAGLDFGKLRPIAAPNVPDSVVQGVADSGLGGKEQIDALFKSSTAAGSATTRGMAREAEDRRKRGEVQTPLKEFLNKMDSFEKETANLDKTYAAVDKSLKQKTLPGDAVVFNFLARQVAGEKGPLSEGDISRFISRAFAGDAQAFENFLTGRSTSKLTDSQRGAFKDLVTTARDGYQNWRKDTASNILGNAALRPELTQGGAPHKALTSKASEYGIELKLDQSTDTYRPVWKKKEKVAPPGKEGAAPITPETDLNALVEMIKDPVQKQQAKDALSHYGGMSIPGMVKEKIKQAAGAK